MKSYSTTEVNGAFTDRQWENYWDLIQEIQRTKNEPSVFKTWQELKSMRLSPSDNTRLKELIIKSEDEPVGRLRLRKRNEDYFEAEIETMFEDPPSSLLSYTASQLLENMNAIGISKVNYRTSSKALNDFSKSIGASLVNHYFYYQLDRKKANTGKIDEWINTIPQRNPKVTLEIHKGVPDEHIDEYASHFISLLEDMPRDASLPPQPPYTAENIKRDLKLDAAQNRQTWVGLLIEEGGIIGQTSLAVHHSNPYQVFQFMTGVRKECRGRGLARWLKAAMFRHLDTFTPQPEMIYTSTYSLNLPMQNVNFAMGYELQKEGFEYTVSRETLNETYNKI